MRPLSSALVASAPGLHLERTYATLRERYSEDRQWFLPYVNERNLLRNLPQELWRTSAIPRTAHLTTIHWNRSIWLYPSVSRPMFVALSLSLVTNKCFGV